MLGISECILIQIIFNCLCSFLLNHIRSTNTFSKCESVPSVDRVIKLRSLNPGHCSLLTNKLNSSENFIHRQGPSVTTLPSSDLITANLQVSGLTLRSHWVLLFLKLIFHLHHPASNMYTYLYGMLCHKWSMSTFFAIGVRGNSPGCQTLGKCLYNLICLLHKYLDHLFLQSCFYGGHTGAVITDKFLFIRIKYKILIRIMISSIIF